MSLFAHRAVSISRQWMYLEPIFCSDDIARQLPAEMKKYGAMERFWRRIMKMASEYPKVSTSPLASRVPGSRTFSVALSPFLANPED